MPETSFTLSHPSGDGSLLITFREPPSREDPPDVFPDPTRSQLLSIPLRLLFFAPAFGVALGIDFFVEAGNELSLTLALLLLIAVGAVSFLGYQETLKCLRLSTLEELEVREGILELRRFHPRRVILRGRAGEVNVYRWKRQSGHAHTLELRIAAAGEDTAIGYGCTDRQLDQLYAEITAALNHHGPESAASGADAA